MIEFLGQPVPEKLDMGNLSHIASILFANTNFTHVRM